MASCWWRAMPMSSAWTIDDAPRELYALRPDRVKAVASASGWPEAYEYSVNGQSVRLPRRAVLHLKLFNPLNDHYGMSPLEAAQRPVDTHNAAAAWHKAMLDNAARPSGALVYAASDGQLTAEQFDRLKAELERSYQGAANAGRPLVLEGGLDWKEMGYSPKEMDFIEAKNGAAREIALAFGIPPMLLGIPGDNTYANYAEANRCLLAADRGAAGQPRGRGHDLLHRRRVAAGPRPRPGRGAVAGPRGPVVAHRRGAASSLTRRSVRRWGMGKRRMANSEWQMANGA